MFETEAVDKNSGPTTTYMLAENAFTTAELDRLVAYGDSLTQKKAI